MDLGGRRGGGQDPFTWRWVRHPPPPCPRGGRAQGVSESLVEPDEYVLFGALVQVNGLLL
jgi:hypothetical protein